MPFAVHTMDPGCPVVAIEDTAEKAAATAESLGYDVGTARVLILPCDLTLRDAVAVRDNSRQLALKIDDMEGELKRQKEVHREAIERERDERARLEDSIHAMRKHTDGGAIDRMKKIRDGLSVAIDALDPSKLVLTRPAPARSV